MVVEWREWEYEVKDDTILLDLNAVNALQNCVLLKKFKIRNIKGQRQLLRKLVNYFDSLDKAFILDEYVIHIEVDSIYFLKGLSCSGLETILPGVVLRDALTVREYTWEYCTPNAKVNSSGVPIKYIHNLILKAIVYAINRMAGSTMGHLTTQPYMSLALKCLEPWIYDWWNVVWLSLCKPLTAFHEGRKKSLDMVVFCDPSSLRRFQLCSLGFH